MFCHHFPILQKLQSLPVRKGEIHRRIFKNKIPMQWNRYFPAKGAVVTDYGRYRGGMIEDAAKRLTGGN